MEKPRVQKKCRNCQKFFHSIRFNGKGYAINSRVYCFECNPVDTPTRFAKPKTCAACSKKFHSLVVDGVRQSIQYRQYCWDCSPFGSGNSRILSQVEKICARCKLPKPLGEFYLKSKSHLRTTYCQSCTKSYSAERVRTLKQKSADHLGGKCKLCGYNRCIAALHFHHLDPSEKEFNFAHYRKASRFNDEVWKKELDKCVLVCGNCHAEIHSGMHPEYLISKGNEVLEHDHDLGRIRE